MDFGLGGIKCLALCWESLVGLEGDMAWRQG